MELGDAVARALAALGITQSLVTRWLGDCCCKERQAKLNSLGYWAARILSGKRERAKEHLEQIVGSPSVLPENPL